MFKNLTANLLLVYLPLIFLTTCAPKPSQTTTNANSAVGNQAPSPNVPPASPKDAPGAVAQNNQFYSADKAIIAKGQALFQNNCTTCHSFKQKGIGPNLAGVTTDVSPAWLTNFIRNAPEVIKSGDARGRRLFEEYNQIMPPFTHFTDQDLQALLAFIHTNKTSPAEMASTAKYGLALKDPIPTKIAPAGLTLTLSEIMTAPATAEKKPLARINKMRVLTGGKTTRHFIQELRGLIYEIADNKLKVFMDITRERPNFIPQPGLATGFGSFAFHPEFYQNGLFYTTHTEHAQAAPADFTYPDSLKVTLQWVLTEWKMKDPHAATFSGTGRELWRVNMMTPIHGVQEITFNPLAKPGSPDYGLLYIGIGDGGAAEAGAYFICNNNQNIWSSVMRIDPQGRNSRNGQYGIPASNPFVRNAQPGTKTEIFARGFRNPNRITWTPDGKMLITDIGLANVEEINIGQAGADYGWPAREGTFLLDYRGKMDRVYALPANDRDYHYTYPVAQFDHDEGNAISGGFVYTGSAVPLLKGKYIFGDVVSGRVFYVDSNQLKLGQQAPIQELNLELAGKALNFQETTASKKTDLRFGLGPKNELYLFTKTDGRIYKVIGSTVNKKA